MNHPYDMLAALNGLNMTLLWETITPNNVNDTDDEHDNTWLRTACSHNMLDDDAVITYILDCGAHINATSKYGFSALHALSLASKINCMRVLLTRGAIVDIMTKEGITPLVFVLRCKHRACARMLLDHGAQLGKVNTKYANIPNWVTSFVAGRERARHVGIILMGALKRVGVNRDLIPLIGQWVWSVRGNGFL
jgi:ankyrin repeat protein